MFIIITIRTSRFQIKIHSTIRTNHLFIIDRIINAENKASPDKILQEIKDIDIELEFMVDNVKKLESKYYSIASDYELQESIEDENKLKRGRGWPIFNLIPKINIFVIF